MIDQDTSSYWRRLLELDQPLPPNFIEQYYSWHRFVVRPVFYFLMGLVFRFWCREKVLGIENLPGKPPYIVASNHASNLDFVALTWAMGKRKEELHPLATKLFYDAPFTGFWVKTGANAVRIDSEKDFFVALRAAAKVLKSGRAVYINPEGLRTLDGKLLPFRPGVGVLAVESGVPLVPVCVSGTLKALPTGGLYFRPHPISVSIGKPIEMAPYIEKKKSVQAYDVYKEVTEELRQRILALQQSVNQ